MRNEKELNADIEEIEKKISAIEDEQTNLNRTYNVVSRLKGNYIIMQRGVEEELNMLQNAEKAAVHTKPGE